MLMNYNFPIGVITVFICSNIKDKIKIGRYK